MKITCESCNTRYSIPDEKIQGAGRTFKIRCKSCGVMMTVKGVEGAGEAAADAGAWYYAVGTDRKGPVTRDALSGLVASGAVNAQTYVWKQGMANWTHLSGVAELADVLSGGGSDEPAESGDGDTAYMSRAEIMAAHATYDPGTIGGQPAAAAAESPAPAAAAVDEPEEDDATMAMAAPDAMVASLFGDSAGSTAAAPDTDDSPFAASDLGASASASSSFASESSTSSGGGGIFGDDDDDDIFSFDSVEDESESPAGIHGRRDSSVLFSLDELAGPGDSAGAQDDALLTETSGLIDIRAVAKNTSGPSDDDDPFAKGSGVGMAPAPAGFTAVSVPIVGPKKSKLPLIIGGVVVVAAAAVAVVFATKSDPPPPPAATQVAKDDTAAAETEKAKAQAAVATAEAAKIKAEAEAEAIKLKAAAEAEALKLKAAAASSVAGAAAAKAAEGDAKAEGEDEDKDDDDGKSTTKRKRPKKATGGSTKKPSGGDSKPAATVAPAERPKEKKVSGTSANALLNALDKKPKASGTTGGGGGGSGPAKLSAAQVRGKLNGAKGKFRACYKLMASPPPGSITVKLQVVISGSGSVSSARVTSGGGASGAVTSCIERAAKRVSFPSFRDSSMTVNYPIRLP